MQWFRRFLEKNGLIGLIMAVAAITYALLIILQGVFQADFNTFFGQLTLPINFETFIRQPWSLLTYWAATHPLAIWMLVIDLAILYTFGNILNAMVGDKLVQGILIYGLLINALLVMILSNVLPTVELTETVHLNGLHLLNCTLIGAAITITPKYNFQIIRWNVPLLAVGLFLLLVPLVAYRAIFTVSGVATIIGGLAGFGLIRLRQSGIDLTAWAQFSFSKDEPSRDPIRVTVRDRKKAAKMPRIQINRKNSAPSDAEELDRLLDKINDVGIEGLNRKEKETLDRLSKD